jgi:rubredoxin
MTRLKCKKCGAVFEQGFGGAILAPHVGPLHYFKCPACSKSSWFNVYKSVKDPITYPALEQAPETEQPLTEAELEKKRIEESKYERT